MSDRPSDSALAVVQGKDVGGYFVASASVEGCWRYVYGDTCSCPAGAHGARTCRHRRAVLAFEAARAPRLAAVPPSAGFFE